MKYSSCILFVFLTYFCSAQDIKGIVVDAESGEALIGATVILQGELSKGITTDIDGRFSLTANKQTGKLSVSYIGFKTQVVPFTSGEGLRISLETEAALMDEVVIKAKKIIAQEFSVAKISKLEVYLNPAAKADVLLAVQSLPASSSVDETANISLRGSPPSETGIFLNNVPIRDAVRLDQSNGVGQFSIFNTSTIQSVNVFPSNPPVEFGGATSGAVALYTDDKLYEKSTSVIASVIGGGFYISRQLGKKTAFAAYGNLSTHHLFTAINPSALGQIKSFESKDAGFYFIHKFNQRSILKIFNFSIFENYEFLTKEPGFDALFSQNKDRNMTVANYSYQWDNARLEFNQGLNFSDAKYSIGNIAHNVKNKDYFASLGFHYFKNNWSIKTGASITQYDVKASGLVPVFFHAYESRHPNQAYEQNNSIGVPEAYIYGKYNFSEKLILGAGSRVYPGFGGNDPYMSNQANLSYKPIESHTFTVSIGNYNKFQFPGVSIPELSISKSNQYALDYKYEEGTTVLSGAIYKKDVDNGFFKNPIYGAELFVSKRGRKLSGSLSLAHINSIIEEENTSYPSRFDLNYFIKIIGKYSIPDVLEINAVYRHRQGTYFLPVIQSQFDPVTDNFIPFYAGITEGDRLPDYKILDIAVSKILSVGPGSLILFVNAGNVLNFKNVRAQSYSRDYSEQVAQLYNGRIVFFGGIYQW